MEGDRGQDPSPGKSLVAIGCFFLRNTGTNTPGEAIGSLGPIASTALIDGWLRMGLLPPQGNFADISYLVEN